MWCHDIYLEAFSEICGVFYKQVLILAFLPLSLLHLSP